MTEITKKAVALVNAVMEEAEKGRLACRFLPEASPVIVAEALIRSIEQHEAFKREVSEAVDDLLSGSVFYQAAHDRLSRFVLPEPDNIACGLALAVEETLELVIGDHDVEKLRAALAARGLEISEKAA